MSTCKKLTRRRMLKSGPADLPGTFAEFKTG